ncbi:hypothetical protein L1887_46948 [Cichorium endivia]|nr:hypothetical protein L1887_46948 [Cichorium endivia]
MRTQWLAGGALPASYQQRYSRKPSRPASRPGTGGFPAGAVAGLPAQPEPDAVEQLRGGAGRAGVVVVRSHELLLQTLRWGVCVGLLPHYASRLDRTLVGLGDLFEAPMRRNMFLSVSNHSRHGAGLKEKQQRLESEHGLGRFVRWCFDQEVGLLEMFDGEDRKVVEADVICIGSYAGNSSTWKWAWSNDALRPLLREKSRLLRALGDLTGIDLFVAESAFAIDDEPMAWELAAISVKYLNALGVYRAPQGTTEFVSGLDGVEADCGVRQYGRRAIRSCKAVAHATGGLGHCHDDRRYGSSRLSPAPTQGRDARALANHALGRSAESWLAMQDAYDLWIARQHVDLQRVGKLALA